MGIKTELHSSTIKIKQQTEELRVRGVEEKELEELSERRQKEKEQFEQQFNLLAREIYNAARTQGVDMPMLFSMMKHPPHPANPRPDALSQSYNNIRNSYLTALVAHDKAVDISKKIRASERCAHAEGIISKCVMTVGVGISIMIVYWIAQYFEIPMPLASSLPKT